LPAGAATGASIGAIAGGAPGALAGAAIGGTIDAVAGAAQFGAESATYAAEIQKLQIALAGVTKNQTDFKKGLDVIATTSRKLNVPIAASTKQFTTLSASVLGAGGTIEQAELVFTGVSNAIKATGGNAEDVQSAIRAMSQIFGKGKVSAEELQGQLGERLAGAVVKFAEANGSSLQKLQKDLRDGTVGLDQVIQFAKKLNVDFAETAEKVANSSADAGQRLKTTMDRLKLAVGQILQPIGAEFQKVFADIVAAITSAIEAFNRFMGIGLSNAIEKTEKDLERARQRLIKSRGDKSRGSVHGGASEYDRALLDYNNYLVKLNELKKQLGDEGTDGTGKGLPEDLGGEKSALKSFAQSAFDVAEQAEQAFVNAFKGMEDALVKFVMTGKLNFSDLARSIIADLTRMFVRFAIVKPLFHGITGGRFLESANGNVFDAGNKITAYARGGIVNKPTLFPMANGMGLMGEAGPEAIMPLKRGANGKLGVQSSGGVGNIVVNVDASGSSVEGDSARSQEFGRALAAAIQSEMIKQKRPGGLLT
jgi:tape measure domain-containing protein